ncbi:MAG: Na+/H+ antiporter NhaC [Synergistaceae bacterium]|nr:Na+/H+ antiporter NhaC [Synergistaceae bacterium]
MDNAKQQRLPNLFDALIVLLFTTAIIYMSVRVWKTDVHIPIAIAAVFAAIYGFFILRCPWSEIADGIVAGINTAMMSLLIMYTIGIVVGAWILSGVVPSMIYYGLSIISPKMFLLCSLIICSVVSIATGSSWGTSGTVGIALIGISAGLGIPTPIAAGIIISGAYFGDKMSPLSDTTNLAPAVSGSDLFQHIRGMIWTTGPTYLIVAAVSIVLGLRYGGGSMDMAKIEAIKSVMKSEFFISPVGLIPPILVIALVALKIPALPALVAGIAAGVAMCIFNGMGLAEIINVLQWGYEPKLIGELAGAGENAAALTELLASNDLGAIPADLAAEVAKMLSELMKRGGFQNMNWTVSLSVVALAYGGIMEKCRFLEALLAVMLKKVRTVGDLVFVTCFSSLIGNVLLADQYMAIVLPGRMFRIAYEEKNLHPRMLSRCLEDVGTITSVLIPWNSCGAFHANLFGISTLAYAPYAILNWLNPIVSVVITYMGIGIAWKNKDGSVTVSRTRPDNA